MFKTIRNRVLFSSVTYRVPAQGFAMSLKINNGGLRLHTDLGKTGWSFIVQDIGQKGKLVLDALDENKVKNPI